LEEAHAAGTRLYSNFGASLGLFGLLGLALCQPHLTQIEAAVVVGLSAQRIYQDLVCDHGFVGSYQAVKRFVRQLRQSQMVAITGRSYRLKDHAAIVGKEDKNKNIKSKSNENSTAESAS